jgi:hypothetical protein
MAAEQKPMVDLNAQAKQAVEETKEQALSAADTYFDILNKAVASFPRPRAATIKKPTSVKGTYLRR